MMDKKLWQIVSDAGVDLGTTAEELAASVEAAKRAPHTGVILVDGRACYAME